MCKKRSARVLFAEKFSPSTFREQSLRIFWEVDYRAMFCGLCLALILACCWRCASAQQTAAMVGMDADGQMLLSDGSVAVTLRRLLDRLRALEAALESPRSTIPVGTIYTGFLW